jgi:heme-degrading monooxygenase HmoA
MFLRPLPTPRHAAADHRIAEQASSKLCRTWLTTLSGFIPTEEIRLMFTRIVECYAKVGMGDDTAMKIRHEVLPILQQQPGFVDLIALRDGNDQQRLLCVSFWNTHESSLHYHREHYDSIVQSLLQTKPSLETMQVEVSTTHRIATSRAA